MKIQVELGEDQFGFRRGNELGIKLGCWNIKTDLGHVIGIVYVLHRHAEGIWPCKMNQINANPKGNWY
jgi:hypothetical protein